MVTIKMGKSGLKQEKKKSTHMCKKKGSIDYLYMHVAQVSDKIIRLSLIWSKYYDNDQVHCNIL
jgi:hypothetical protein